MKPAVGGSPDSENMQIAIATATSGLVDQLLRHQYPAHPDFAISDWLRLAKRLMAVGPGGRIAFDYDMKIAEPFAAPDGAAAGDSWPAFRALAGILKPRGVQFVDGMDLPITFSILPRISERRK